MHEEQILSAEEYFTNAELALRNKDLLDFVANISNAELLARTNTTATSLAEVTFLKVKGLFRFSKHHKVVKTVPQALKYNTEFIYL